MINTCKFGIIIAFVLCGSMQLKAQQSNECKVSARISPEKESYIFREPIRLKVSLSNLGPESEEVSLIFPYFDGLLRFTADGEQLILREEYSEASVGFGGKSIPRIIEPGTTWTFPIFFQTYFASLPAGNHTLHYKFDVPCLVRGESLNATSSSGTFSIHVEPKNEGELARIIAEYSRALDEGGDSAALEALLSMDTPLVIPELKKLLDGSHWERAFQTLSRFKGNEEAVQMVQGALHSKRVSHQIVSLKVLSKWKTEIRSSDLQELLESPSKDLRVAALRYLQALNDPKYLPLIAPLVNDPDGTVADEARRTRELLKR